MLEQAPMFFISLWGFAFMLGADRAATLGWVYLGLRALYAPIWMIDLQEKAGTSILKMSVKLSILGTGARRMQ